MLQAMLSNHPHKAHTLQNSIIPLFHYSIIPLFHYSIIPTLRYSSVFDEKDKSEEIV
jgi:hypothetical protein